MTDQNHHIEENQLQAYLDGALEPAIAEKVRDHITACQTCQEELTRLEIITSHLENLPEVELSRDLANLVVEKLKEEQSLSPAITWTLVIEALAAGGVLGVLIPAFQAAGWFPQLQDTRLELQAAVNIFLTQLASSWLVWWAGLKLQLSQLMISFNPLEGLALEKFSPWILIGVAGGLAILINALLLGRQPLSNHNHKQLQV